jgi:transposase
VRLVRETGRRIAEVARDLGINEGALGNWVNADRRRRGDGNGALSEDERAGVARLRKENAGQERVHQSHAGATGLWR